MNNQSVEQKLHDLFPDADSGRLAARLGEIIDEFRGPVPAADPPGDKGRFDQSVKRDDLSMRALVSLAIRVS